MNCSKRTKRLLSMLLALAMCFTLLQGMTAFAAGGTYTAIFTPGTGFTNSGVIYAYYWGSGSNPVTWPGKQMTENDGSYTVNFSLDSEPIGIIFNSGSTQTPDLDFIADGAEREIGSDVGTYLIVPGDTYDLYVGNTQVLR